MNATHQKIVLSRKGYDAGTGGRPSPIMPDGRMLSIPIPAKDGRKYSELSGADGKPITEALQDLNLFKHGVDAYCHLDPDLAAWSVPRAPNWKPSFGQNNAAAGHLENKGVGIGDLFLFFGWFRRTEIVGGKLRFVRGEHQDLHVIFGWLEIGEIVEAAPGSVVPDWLSDHPHCSNRLRATTKNRIYVARDRRMVDPDQPGAGVFVYDDRRVLTKPSMSRTCWALDRGIFGDRQISYHSADSWKEGYFQSAAKGQEFVITADEGVDGWLRSLMRGTVTPA